MNYQGPNGENHSCIVMFNDFQRLLMSRRECVILGDGTFQYVPLMYKQLYTFHLLVGNMSFPLLFVYSESRNKNMYMKLFEYMKNELKIDLYKFMSDFEIAVRISVKHFYPNALIVGCWFHFINSLLKRIKKLGLQKLYNKDKQFNQTIRKYIALCFIPIDQVHNFHGIIVGEINNITNEDVKAGLLQFNEYFERVWMDGKYLISDWNQTDDIRFRTNN